MTAREPHPWERFVAVGDSFTEGLEDHDPRPGGTYVGWADRLAGHLAGRAAAEGRWFGYANLAVRSRFLDDIAGPQLDRALSLDPDLVAFVAGGNDILRPFADPDLIAARMDATVARIRATGADVLLATAVDPLHAPVLRHMRGRFAVFSANTLTIAARHDAYVLNLWGMSALRHPQMWAPDRVHLTSEGHRRIALAALTALGHVTDAADWAVPLPPAPPPGPARRLVANAIWAREHAAPWLRRRLRGPSTSPTLLPKRPALEPVTEPGW